ncbi:polysulfide reductase NrfD [Solirubrobacter soli]|uniref:polysulfide reductase NrfD n=1 Tax=Solirubrobacter soli TaxID=363832 RepID=UPI00040D8C5B|nr:polysulfide reductase NrfD [Solirubrobacter soli]
MRPELVPAQERPIIKPPVWTPEIPLYFYVGGLAGGSAGFGLLSGLRGEDAIARRAWGLALAGSAVSPALLISDLGVPSRFLNMLRMVKVTSPMSIGSWVLAGFGTATAPAALHAFTRGRLGAFGTAAQVTSGLLGLPLSAYTAALIANTAVPVWREARAELPFVFCGGAAASAGAALTLLSPVEEASAARRLAIGGAAVEVLVAQVMERRLRALGVGAPYKRSAVHSAAKALTLAGAAMIAARGARSRGAAITGGALVSAGALTERWAIFRAGTHSAQRPRDTVIPQRERIRSGLSRGAARSGARRAAPESTDGTPGRRSAGYGSPAFSLVDDDASREPRVPGG